MSRCAKSVIRPEGVRLAGKCMCMLVCSWKDLFQRYLNKTETEKSSGMDWVWRAIELSKSVALCQTEGRTE